MSVAESLYRRIVTGGEPFWDVVREPFLRRRLAREDLLAFLERAFAESGGSYKRLASLLRLEDEYKRLMNFLQNHDLRPRG